MSPVIRISDPIYQKLQSLAEPFTDTPASVIQKLLDFHDQHEQANHSRVTSSEEVQKPNQEVHEEHRSSISNPPSTITQDDLIPYIVKSLQNHSSRARKETVQDDVYKALKEVFDHPYYHETVSHNVPRWLHNVAWAKERAKKRGLIQRPDESGRGWWALTDKGMCG